MPNSATGWPSTYYVCYVITSTGTQATWQSHCACDIHTGTYLNPTVTLEISFCTPTAVLLY